MHNQIAQRVPFNAARSDLIQATISQDEIAAFKPTYSGFSFWLKGIPAEIKIELSINGEHGGFNFHTSHSIKTPLQAGPYHPSRPWGDDASYALHMAVRMRDRKSTRLNSSHMSTSYAVFCLKKPQESKIRGVRRRHVHTSATPRFLGLSR